MSSKSILCIDLTIEKDFRDQEELKKLKAFSGLEKGFAGWTYWGHIGTVYNIAENYENLFAALDSAGDAFLPIICNFQEIKITHDILSLLYVPKDIKVLSKFREHMRNMGVNFKTSPLRDLFVSIEIENIDLKETSILKSWVPQKKEIAFVAASITKSKSKLRVYHRTKEYKSGNS